MLVLVVFLLMLVLVLVLVVFLLMLVLVLVLGVFLLMFVIVFVFALICSAGVCVSSADVYTTQYFVHTI